MNNDFEIFYPGIYDKEDREALARYKAECDAIRERGNFTPAELVNGLLNPQTPGVGKVYFVESEPMHEIADRLDPDNVMYFDQEYAQYTEYGDKVAHPSFASVPHIYSAPMPAELRDILLVTGLHHETTWYQPMYWGDILYFVTDKQEYTDITPQEGSEYRTFLLEAKGHILNQKAEVVSETSFGAMESLKRYKDPAKRNKTDEALWECPNWWTRAPHYYTDADWELIKKIWSKEFRRGAEPLYWENVQIGDEPAWVAEGPIFDGPQPNPIVGAGTGGTRALKREIMDPEQCASLIRGERDGIYRLPGTTPSYESDPEHDLHQYKDYREIIINFFSRDVAIRMLTNWIGEKGWLKNIKWNIMSIPVGYEDRVPSYLPSGEQYLRNVPHMAGKVITTHCMEGDMMIVKSYVHNKYVKNGEFLAELTWWCETIEGDVFTEGLAVVRLPSRNI